MPEEGEQPPLDAVELGDGLHHGQPLRALREAIDQHRVHLGIAGELDGEVAVEDPEVDLLDDRPADLRAHELRRLLRLPGAHEVTGTEQLRGDVVLQRDLPRHDPVDQQQADVLGPGGPQALRIPRAALERVQPAEEVAARVDQPLALEQAPQLRICVEQVDAALRRHDGDTLPRRGLF